MQYQVWSCTRKNRTLHTVIVTTMMCYGERIPSKISKRIRHMGRNTEETRHMLLRGLS